jgi:single-stranded-DNA-specific exonuclease
MDQTDSNRIPIEDALPAAREKAAAFFGALRDDARVVVFCHFDADGLSAGALFGRGLARMGFGDVRVVHSERGESAFKAHARGRLAAMEPDALVVTDLGVHADGTLPGVPTLYVDHHRPEGEPADPAAAVVTGYGWEPIPTSAWMAYDLLSPLAPIEDLAWIAAVGTVGDLGDKAPWSGLPPLRKKHGKALREAVSLINAARRASPFDVSTPLAMLMAAEGPGVFLDDASPEVARLYAYREEVQAELAQARKAAPIFSATGPYALVALDSPCQVHPLIAQQWRTRLAKFAVIAANRGYLPGIVAFSSRTSRNDLVLPEILRSIDLGSHEHDVGRGHDQASGGQLPPELFNRLMDGLGFDERAHV